MSGDPYVNYEALHKMSDDELDQLIEDGGPYALWLAAVEERADRKAGQGESE